MTIIFGTLGFTPEKLLPTVRATASVRKLHFYHDDHERSREAAERVRAFCRDLRLDVEGVELDAFDIIECARRMRRDLQRAGAENAVFNITGGTPVISSAATLACILEGVRAVYIHETTREEIPLPLLSLRYEEILNKEQRRVLGTVAAAGPAGITQAEIGRRLDLARATVSHHVTKLKRKQLLRAETDEADARSERLFVRESAALLLMDEAEGPPA